MPSLSLKREGGDGVGKRRWEGEEEQVLFMITYCPCPKPCSRARLCTYVVWWDQSHRDQRRSNSMCVKMRQSTGLFHLFFKIESIHSWHVAYTSTRGFFMPVSLDSKYSHYDQMCLTENHFDLVTPGKESKIFVGQFWFPPFTHFPIVMPVNLVWLFFSCCL